MSHEHLHHHDHEPHEHHDYANPYELAFSKFNLHLHDDEIAQQAERIIAEHIDENDTPLVRERLLSFMDVTSLRVTDTDEHILSIVEHLNRVNNEHPDLPSPAALCVYPNFVELVAQSLEVEQTAIAAVAGGFPSGQMRAEVKAVEVSMALKDGATEIDTLLPIGHLLSEDYEEVETQIEEIKNLCGERTLKVILETGALDSAERIKRAAIMAMYSGADFLKTSTGKIDPGATPKAVAVLCEAIKEYYDENGRKIGLKVAGGLNSPTDALGYYTLVREMLGEEWLTPKYFRIGTSRLYDRLVDELAG